MAFIISPHSHFPSAAAFVKPNIPSISIDFELVFVFVLRLHSSFFAISLNSKFAVCFVLRIICNPFYWCWACCLHKQIAIVYIRKMILIDCAFIFIKSFTHTFYAELIQYFTCNFTSLFSLVRMLFDREKKAPNNEYFIKSIYKIARRKF